MWQETSPDEAMRESARRATAAGLGHHHTRMRVVRSRIRKAWLCQKLRSVAKPENPASHINDRDVIPCVNSVSRHHHSTPCRIPLREQDQQFSQFGGILSERNATR